MITSITHKRLWLLILLLAGLTLTGVGSGLAGAPQGPEKSPEPPAVNPERLVARVFKPRFAQPPVLEKQINHLYRGAAVALAQPDSRSLIVRATPEVMAAIEELLKELDAPPPAKKNIELTAYLLLSRETPGAEDKLPEVLDPVIRQLKNTFAQKNYRLLDTFILRSQDGQMTRASGYLPVNPFEHAVQPNPNPASYTLEVEPKLSPDEKGGVVEISHLSFEVGERIGDRMRSGAIHANLHLRAGQMAVVGKTNADGSSNMLFLVITAKVLD